MKLILCAFAVLLAGCATGSFDSRTREAANWPRLDHAFDHAVDPEVQGAPRPPSGQPNWRTGQALLQGFLGVSFYDKVKVDGGASSPVDGAQGDLDEMPLLGGGGQWKFGGDKLDWGLEAFMSMEGRADAAAFVIGGGGAAVAVDTDLLVIDIYGGPFVSTFLGERLRAYGSAGPLIGFAFYDQSNFSDDGSGFGYGFYARTGLEFLIGSRSLIGAAVMWSDTNFDLNSRLGDLEIEGFQAMVTFTRGL